MIGEWITDILELFLDFSFWGNKKDTPAHEKKLYVSKKSKNSSVARVYIIGCIIILSAVLLFFFLLKPMQQVSDTKDTLQTITHLLKLEKEHANQYPETIDGIARRNPTLGDLSIDSWNNAIFYQKAENGESYTLISKGKDGVLHTDDDIVIHKNFEQGFTTIQTK
ncbi:hypothetical protein IMCC3317_06560 [Kordia antarctica]|uniref:Type II secretion system protein GspG C-terminal domain-containing protein n=1 Tax=Kordia antarctica TaxID=1218801 RepID=A0A7L4ZFP2_9FLAO|nr:hypothetical protein [Kordia antarctica]QHI35310.1 hypothetical protein IMCC3317_06560 [Kordia antarctica]